MSNEIEKQEIKKIIKKSFIKNNELDTYKPFQKDILLFDTYVAGTSHIENIEKIEKQLNINDRLEFFRQADNSSDTKAIEIRTAENIKIGYVPKQDNIVFSRLMDAGKLLYAKITNKEYYGTWVKIYIEIYLHEI